MAERFRLHGIWLSGPAYKAGLMLSLAGRKFDYVHVNLRAGEHKQPAFLKKNRFGQVPCLEDTKKKQAVVQSPVILEYLADEMKKFRGASAKDRIAIREWLFWEFDKLAPPMYRARGIRIGLRQASFDIAAMYHNDGLLALKTLDSALKGKKWLVGKTCTIADINIYGSLSYGPAGGFDLSALPNVSAWKKRFEAQKHFMPPDQLLPKESRRAA